MLQGNCQIIVCLTNHPKTMALMRAAKKKARDENCGWTALYVQTPEHFQRSAKWRERVLRYLTQAKDMGAEVSHVEATNVLEGILAYTKNLKMDKAAPRYIVVGKNETEGFWNVLRPSLAEQLTRHLADEWEVHVVPLPAKQESSRWLTYLKLRQIRIRDIFYALFAVFLAFVGAEALKMFMPIYEFELNYHNVSLVFLIACAFCAGRFGLLSGLIASILSVAIINYVYINPMQEFNLRSATDALNMLLFLSAAVVLSLFSSFTRSHAEASRKREKRTEALYNVSTILNKSTSQEQASVYLQEELTRLLEMETVFFLLNKEGDLVVGDEYDLLPNDLSALQVASQQHKTTGYGTAERYGSDWRFEPLTSPNGFYGVLGIKINRSIRIDASFGKLVTALADQSASALERIANTANMEEARLNEEREKLRAMLLSSVSHDLKTPLASIIGSLSVYHDMSDRLDENRKLTLTQTALEEAHRLENFITNILEMTRLESGDIKFKREWHDPKDVVMRVRKRLRDRLRNHEVMVKQNSTAMPEVEMDVMMTEQVLQNVLDNAAKYTPEHTLIEISFTVQPGGAFSFIIRDHGEGIPEVSRKAIFSKYTRLKKKDSQIAGTGLGLAICESIMQAQGGGITVHNHKGGGAVFTITLPRSRDIAAIEPEEDDSPVQEIPPVSGASGAINTLH